MRLSREFSKPSIALRLRATFQHASVYSREPSGNYRRDLDRIRLAGRYFIVNLAHNILIEISSHKSATLGAFGIISI